ncbi:hypothetical protein AVEN_6482-1 [Araneus ventricosus]|uniref:Uncharacterized protein n=1 Tax=Araneus ventricosus TaxID=182803 RepID=A0A4Y2H7L7_ARAVE|nr:hypothetical protein AVEN_6482-1 [Araneus ventricosus]
MDHLPTFLLLNFTVFLTSHWLSPYVSQSSKFLLHHAKSPLSLTATLRTFVVHSHLDSAALDWPAAKEAKSYLNWTRPSFSTRPAPESNEGSSRSLSSYIFTRTCTKTIALQTIPMRHCLNTLSIGGTCPSGPRRTPNILSLFFLFFVSPHR